MVVAGLGVLLLAIVVALWTLDQRRAGRGWIDGILGDAPTGSTSAALHSLLLDRRSLAIGAGLALAVYVVFYTSLFTNLEGLASGSFGALGCWLGQQGVQRGEQPWLYYLLLLPQYEFIAVVIFPFAVAWVVWRWVGARRAGRSLSRRFFVCGFLIYWAILMFGILSWAGEKMPWIAIQIALPLTLVAASILGEVVEWLKRHGGYIRGAVRRANLALGASIIGVVAAGFLTLAWASAGPYVTATGAAGSPLQRTIRPWMVSHWWLVYLPWLLLIALLAYAAVRLGAKRTIAVLAVAGTLVLGIGEVHTAWHVSYRAGDVPTDMLIYVQTSPYVTRVVQELQVFSQETTGGMGLEVWYDAGTQ